MRNSLLRLSSILALGAILVMGVAAPESAFAKAGHKRAATTTAAHTPLSELHVIVDRAVPVTLSAPASSVFIANPAVADIQVLSPTSIMVFGKKTGETTLMASDLYGRPLLQRTVLVEQDLADLRAALKVVIPNNKIEVQSVPNGIILTGEASDTSIVEDARRLAARYITDKDSDIINRIKVRGSNQVMIRVRFAEVSRDVDKRLGINWESTGNVLGLTTGMAAGSSVISDGANLLDRYRTVTSNDTNDIISFSKTGSNYNINGVIDALAKDGFVTILAEPTLTAMSGETASFLAGGEFPVPVPQSQTTVTIEWKQYGVSLAFTPTILGDNRLNLHVRPEVSQLSDSGAVTLNEITVPALTTRRAETTIEMASGQSFAIGGLLNNNQSQAISKYPFLGDIPILGNLFRSTRFQNKETELVILITPYVVKPTNGPLALPTDGYRQPTDAERTFGQRMTSGYENGRPMSGEATATPAYPPAMGEEAPTPHAAPIEPVQLPENSAPLEKETGSPRSEAAPPFPPLPLADKPPQVSQGTGSAPAEPAPSPATRAALPAPSAQTQTTLLDVPAGPGGYILE